MPHFQQGPLLCGLGQDVGDDPGGFGSVHWTNPNNITVNDDVTCATVVLNNQSTFGLRATTFAFSTLPAGAILTGFEFDVRCDNNSLNHSEIAFVTPIIGGVISGSLHASQLAPLNSPGTLIFGGDGDLWGLSPAASGVTPDANFGFVFDVATHVFTNVTTRIFSCFATVWYDAPNQSGCFASMLDN